MEELVSSLEAARLEQRVLLVLDLNGVLVERVYWSKASREERADVAALRAGNFLVWTRPNVTEFVEFALERFAVGVWSSAMLHNVDKLLDVVFGRRRRELLFEWDQRACLSVKPHPDPTERKPLFQKPLQRIWDTFPQFGAHNTLLLDDSPLKAAHAPLNLLLVPAWTHDDERDDALKEGGAVRAPLQRLLDHPGTSVQEVVRSSSYKKE